MLESLPHPSTVVNINKSMKTFTQYITESQEPIHTVCAYCQKEGVPGHRKQDHPIGYRISHGICPMHLEKELQALKASRPLHEGLFSWGKTATPLNTPRPQPTGPNTYHGMELRSGKTFTYDFPKPTTASLARKLQIVNNMNKESKDAWKFWID